MKEGVQDILLVKFWSSFLVPVFRIDVQHYLDGTCDYRTGFPLCSGAKIVSCGVPRGRDQKKIFSLLIDQPPKAILSPTLIREFN